MSVNSYRQDEDVRNTSKLKTLMRLYSYLLNYKKQILLVLLIMGITVAITIVNPLYLEYAVDHYIKRKDFKGLFLLMGSGIVLNLFMALMIKVRIYMMAKVSNKVLVNIRQTLYTHIQTLDFSFFDSRPTGKILARIIGDINSLHDVLENSVTTLLPDFFTVVAVVVIMVTKNAKLALASLSSLSLMVVGMWFIQTVSHKRWQINRKKSSNLNAFVHEDLAGMKIIQSFHAEDEAYDEFNRLVFEQRHSFIRAVRLNDAFGSVVDFCWGFGCIALYYVGIRVIGVEQVTVGTFLAFASYISMFWMPIMNLSNFYNQLVTNISGAERIFEIIDTKPEIADGTDVKEIPPIQGDICFEHVGFSYEEGTKILNDVSFHINPGETVALVGPTGAGKTTIVNLISRFYDIQEGKIRIDGHDLKKVTIESLRQQMGIMTQDNFLFSGTIRDNIRYGKLDATDEEIIAAAKAVNAHDFIMHLPKQYDTELIERGGGLSIGQRQLLAFARTMVSEPKILILDEATSSIDTNTELLVQKGIENLLKDRTSFVIAHRLSTIQKADRIFVIDQGGILEQGTPTELMAKKGAYYRLYMAQFKNVS